VDLDDEIMRCNGGTWPDIPTKNAVVLPKVIAAIRTMPDVVLFGNLPVERTQELRQAGFSTALLDVSETELRRRHAVRLAEEGWTNVEWFDHEQEVIRDMRSHDVFDHVIDGQRTVAEIADDIMKMAEDVQRRISADLHFAETHRMEQSGAPASDGRRPCFEQAPRPHGSADDLQHRDL
jgi:hypothetical protein